jgi:hypothetical protein
VSGLHRETRVTAPSEETSWVQWALGVLVVMGGGVATWLHARITQTADTAKTGDNELWAELKTQRETVEHNQQVAQDWRVATVAKLGELPTRGEVQQQFEQLRAALETRK